MSLQDSHQISDVKVMLMKGIDGRGIVDIEKTGAQGLVDIYTITYTDGTKSTYTITNGASGGMTALLLITSDAGSEVTVTSPSGRDLRVTQVAGSTTQWECETTEYGVHTIDAVLGGDDAQVTVNVDTCKIYLIDDSHFHANITVKYPDGFTCRCQGSQESSYATGSPYTFSVHSADTYTITVTDGVDTYTATVVITTDGQSESLTCPAPADASANNLDFWLFYGDVDGSYSTLADVLADSTALATLMSSTDAVDYLVRCTSWVSDITGNQSAMSYIGLNNYCANTLLSDSTWLNGICNSLYIESVLNVKVPTMTSNTTPSGVASANREDNYAYCAFDGDSSTRWVSGSGFQNDYVSYKFTRNVAIYAFKATFTNVVASVNYKIQSLISGTWTDVSENVTSVDGDIRYTTSHDESDEYRLYINSQSLVYGASYYGDINILQFYGREDV